MYQGVFTGSVTYAFTIAFAIGPRRGLRVVADVVGVGPEQLLVLLLEQTLEELRGRSQASASDTELM
jgi:hypothetical protein